MTNFLKILIPSLFLLLGNSLFCQSSGNIRPTTLAIPISEEPVIDGKVMEDALWQSIKPFGDLTQTQPNFGNPASEKTEIRIAYTTETFFVSVVCYDSRPNNLVVSDARRDEIWTIQMPFFLFWIPIGTVRTDLFSEPTP